MSNIRLRYAIYIEMLVERHISLSNCISCQMMLLSMIALITLVSTPPHRHHFLSSKLTLMSGSVASKPKPSSIQPVAHQFDCIRQDPKDQVPIDSITNEHSEIHNPMNKGMRFHVLLRNARVLNAVIAGGRKNNIVIATSSSS